MTNVRNDIPRIAKISRNYDSRGVSTEKLSSSLNSSPVANRNYSTSLSYSPEKLDSARHDRLPILSNNKNNRKLRSIGRSYKFNKIPYNYVDSYSSSNSHGNYSRRNFHIAQRCNRGNKYDHYSESSTNPFCASFVNKSCMDERKHNNYRYNKPYSATGSNITLEGCSNSSPTNSNVSVMSSSKTNSSSSVSSLSLGVISNQITRHYEDLPLEFWERSDACREAKSKHMERLDSLCDSREKLVLLTTLEGKHTAIEPNMFPCKIFC